MCFLGALQKRTENQPYLYSKAVTHTSTWKSLPAPPPSVSSHVQIPNCPEGSGGVLPSHCQHLTCLATIPLKDLGGLAINDGEHSPVPSRKMRTFPGRPSVNRLCVVSKVGERNDATHQMVGSTAHFPNKIPTIMFVHIGTAILRGYVCVTGAMYLDKVGWASRQTP